MFHGELEWLLILPQVLRVVVITYGTQSRVLTPKILASTTISAATGSAAGDAVDIDVARFLVGLSGSHAISNGGGCSAAPQVPVSRRCSVAALPTPAAPPPPPAAPSTSTGIGDGVGNGARTVVFIKGRPIGLDLDDFLCVRGVRPDSQGYTNSVRPFEAITELTVA